MSLPELLHSAERATWPIVAQSLDLPGCERPLAYALQYWPSTLRNLLRPHRLRAQVQAPRLVAAVAVPAALRQRWEQLFNADARCPLLVNQSVGTLLYTRLFGQLGLNFRHLLHLQHRTLHASSPEALAASPRQQLDCHLEGCWRLPDDKALVALRTEILRPLAEGGAPLATVQDRFLIRRVRRSDWEQLPPVEGRGPLRELVGLRRRRAELDPAQGLELALALPRDLGRRYGGVSGDHNPVHTAAWAARLFGLRRPFVQGLALRSLIVAALHRLDLPLQSLQLTFAQPAYLGQMLRLVLQDERFELLDEAQQVVAFGRSSD
ncbi:MaoC/PaaZ C-terminal domain-containing protein [Inhella sp.]|uniref:MaoC/PaaZ C-terminal domain-containing protein n=1 Tax=Inhella sp. TaxID=1921806 RepID=UPI0035B1732D